jgi:hypothetical protein
MRLLYPMFRLGLKVGGHFSLEACLGYPGTLGLVEVLQFHGQILQQGHAHSEVLLFPFDGLKAAKCR